MSYKLTHKGSGAGYRIMTTHYPPYENPPCHLCERCVILEQNIAALQQNLQWYQAHLEQKCKEDHQAKKNYNERLALLQQEVDTLALEKNQKENAWKEALVNQENERKELAALDAKLKALDAEISANQSLGGGKPALEKAILVLENELKSNNETMAMLEQREIELEAYT